MRQYVFLFACAWLCRITSCLGETALMEQVNQLEQHGQFKQAASLLAGALHESSLPTVDRKKLEFELDRLSRIKRDFPFSKDELFAELKKAVKGLSQEEFEAWVKEGRFDSREIDGKRYFMSSSVSNLFFRYPEL